jgi:hypothetical protein
MPRQSGVSIITVLLIVVTLAGGMAYLLVATGPNVQNHRNTQTTTQLIAQAQLIAHRITKCATDYSEANNGSTVHKAYPLGTDAAVTSLTCPTVANPNLWSGVDGVFPPTPIDGFGAWKYTKAINLGDPTFIEITSSQPSAHSAAMSAAATKMGAAASVQTKTVVGDTLRLVIIQ